MNNLKISRFTLAQNSLCHYWKSFVILLNCFSLLSKIALSGQKKSYSRPLDVSLSPGYWGNIS